MPATSTTDPKWERILALDLNAVRVRLTEKKGWWWSLRYKPMRLEKEYRQFIYLIATNPDRLVIPWSQPLDDFWHEHILDTAKYAADCQNVLGKFIHHNPNVPKYSSDH